MDKVDHRDDGSEAYQLGHARGVAFVIDELEVRSPLDWPTVVQIIKEGLEVHPATSQGIDFYD